MGTPTCARIGSVRAFWRAQTGLQGVHRRVWHPLRILDTASGDAPAVEFDLT
jgi:hypothetical protein